MTWIRKTESEPVTAQWVRELRDALPDEGSTEIVIPGGRSVKYLSLSRSEIEGEWARLERLRNRRRRMRAVLRFRAARRRLWVKLSAGASALVFLFLLGSLGAAWSDRAGAAGKALATLEELAEVNEAFDAYLGLTAHLLDRYGDTLESELAGLNVDIPGILASGSADQFAIRRRLHQEIPDLLRDRLSPDQEDLLLGNHVLRNYVLRLPSVQPLPESRVTSGFGPRRHPISGRLSHHNGVDMVSDTDPTVLASHSGEVTRAGRDGGYGLVVEVTSPWGIVSRYAHLRSFSVAEGASVSAGDPIGVMGNTGLSTAPHLHWEVRIGSSAVDPMTVLEIAQRVREEGTF